MTIKRNATGTGSAAANANALIGGVITTEAGAGSTRTDATLLSLISNHIISTAANNSGVILPPGNGSGDGLAPGDYMTIYNGSANTLLLYPPAGGSLNGGVVSTGTVSIATKTSVQAMSIDGLLFTVAGPNT